MCCRVNRLLHSTIRVAEGWLLVPGFDRGKKLRLHLTNVLMQLGGFLRGSSQQW
jgi:hypothetical protein